MRQLKVGDAFTNATKKTLTPEFIKFIFGEFKVPPGTVFESRIGSASKHGAIFSVKGDNDHVIKVIQKTADFKYEFENEVRVGQTEGIEKVGTKIYGDVYGQTSGGKYIGMYAMDNLLYGDSELNTELITLSEWIEMSGNVSRCPPGELMDLVVYKYIKLLFDFYKITKGWHGDMHPGNIQVAIDRRTRLIKRMRVIDYGTHTPFKNQAKLEKASCITEIVKDIRTEFDNMTTRHGTQMFWGTVRHKYTNKGNQPVIGNHVPLNSDPLFKYAVETGILTRMNLRIPRTNNTILNNMQAMYDALPTSRRARRGKNWMF